MALEKSSFSRCPKVPLLPIPQFEVEDWGLEQNPGY